MENEDFDLNAEIASFEKEWDEPETDPKDDVDLEADTDIEDEKEPDIKDEADVDPEPEKVEDKPNLQTEEQNKAFAEMRRQLESEKRYADVIRKIAEKNGTDPDKLLEQYQDQELESQAEEQKTPVDVLKRLQALENENAQMREQSTAEKFNSQVEKTKAEYSLGDNDIKEVFKYYQENNLTASTPFDQVYRLANFDTLMEKKVKEARQSELSEKKKRQETTAIPNTDSASPQTGDLTDDAWAEQMKSMGLSIE